MAYQILLDVIIDASEIYGRNLSSSSFAVSVVAATERESSGTTSRVSTRFHRRSVTVAFAAACLRYAVLTMTL